MQKQDHDLRNILLGAIGLDNSQSDLPLIETIETLRKKGKIVGSGLRRMSKRGRMEPAWISTLSAKEPN